MATKSRISFFNDKSTSFINSLIKKKGWDYAILIRDETVGIIRTEEHEGYCFNENQMKDIRRLCALENVKVNVIPTYKEDEDEIDFYTIRKNNTTKKIRTLKTMKEIARKERLLDMTKKEDTKIKKEKIIINTDIKKEMSIEDFRKQLILQYGF